MQMSWHMCPFLEAHTHTHKHVHTNEAVQGWLGCPHLWVRAARVQVSLAWPKCPDTVEHASSAHALQVQIDTRAGASTMPLLLR